MRMLLEMMLDRIRQNQLSRDSFPIKYSNCAISSIKATRVCSLSVISRSLLCWNFSPFFEVQSSPVDALGGFEFPRTLRTRIDLDLGSIL